MAERRHKANFASKKSATLKAVISRQSSFNTLYYTEDNLQKAAYITVQHTKCYENETN
jgi:hypothetical protein